MYQDYFHLKAMPFSIAPDPQFLFMSERYCEAMAHLLYGVEAEGGFVLLTGEVGTGKTTICRSMIQRLPEKIDAALILNPRMSAEELLQTVCEELHIEVEKNISGIKKYIDALNLRLLSNFAAGRRAILIVDEAQNLSPEVLEQLRLLTNLETDTCKLLQIFLIGQPELNDMLARPELRQVSQRVIARYHLTHLNQDEVRAYIAHRLQLAGGSPLIFPKKLFRELTSASKGVPRLINLICDRALLGAYSQGKHQITPPILDRAIREVLPGKKRQKFPTTTIAWALLAIAGITAIAATQLAKMDWGQPAEQAVSIAHSSPDRDMQLSASAPAALPILSPLKWPEQNEFPTSEKLAFRALFRLYEIEFDPLSPDSPCTQAESRGWRCYSGHGGLSELTQLDQPVLLRLSAPDGKEYSATLISLNQGVATVDIAGTAQLISQTELANSWLGQFVVIWKAPPDFNAEISPNHRGADVVWLRQGLESVDGIHNDGADIFDTALSMRIRAFQLDEGIQPDGLVGPRTMIRLNVRNNQSIPHLTTEHGR